jgi:hypothetical protein
MNLVVPASINARASNTIMDIVSSASMIFPAIAVYIRPVVPVPAGHCIPFLNPFINL